MFWRNLSFKRKLMLMMLLTIASGVVLIGLFFVIYERVHMREQLEHEIQVVAKVATSQLTTALMFDDLETQQESANSLRFDNTIEIVCIYGANGALQVQSYPGEVRHPPCPSAPAVIGNGFSDGHYNFRRTIYSDDVALGSFYVRANLAYVEHHMRRYIYMMLTALAVISVVSLLVSLWLQQVITRSITHLAETAGRIAHQKDYSLRAEKLGDDEIGQTVDAFNQMLHVVEQRDNELKRNKNQLEVIVNERTAELRTANRELEAFSYSVSHDLRSPLRAIDGFSQALLEEYSEQLDDVGRSYLDRVRANSQRMGVLIDNLLRLSRVTRQELQPEPTDISQMAQEIIRELREGEGSRRVEVSIQDGMTAQCDAKLIRIALNNLIENAWKYSSKQTQSVIDVGCENGVFYVRDNGAGFDMRYADKLFGAFQRLHTKEEFEGTGVGLATVARVIHRHGGEIWAESELGSGATFYFTLP